MKLMWAYGSNLNKRQMLLRCPAAVPLEALTVQNLILRFRGVADVAYRTGAYCEGALWAITRDCERALDDYEGVGSGGFGGLYRKCHFDYVDPDSGEQHRVLYYKMNRHGIMPPSEGYLDCILQGYADFGIDTARLIKAVEHAWRRKDMNGFMAYRWEKAGKPRMARIERIATVFEGDVEGDPEPGEITKLPTKQAARDTTMPDVCLRVDPDNPNHCRAVVLTEKGERYFAENIKADKEDTEWRFKFSTHVVAGLLQKKRLSVTILEKLRKLRA
jgi:hypothetical protein